MRGTSRWSWFMAGGVSLVGGCQPGEEPASPGASSSLATGQVLLTGGTFQNSSLKSVSRYTPPSY